MKIIIGISLTLDLEDIMKKFIENPVQRLKNCFVFDCWIEKKR